MKQTDNTIGFGLTEWLDNESNFGQMQQCRCHIIMSRT